MLIYMTSKSDFIELAKESSLMIDKWLKENYAGQTITKNAIRLKFGLPHSRQSLIFTILQNMGYEMSWRNVTVPSEQK